jgi:hypothetical protein
MFCISSYSQYEIAPFECSVEGEIDGNGYRNNGCNSITWESAEEFSALTPEMVVKCVFHIYETIEDDLPSFVEGPLYEDPWQTPNNYGSAFALHLIHNMNVRYGSKLIANEADHNNNPETFPTRLKFEFKHDLHSELNYKFYPKNNSGFMPEAGALNIRIRGNHVLNAPSGCYFVRGDAFPNTHPARIGLQNVPKNVLDPPSDCLSAAGNMWAYVSTVVHELGHMLNLNHTFTCNNPCHGIAYNFYAPACYDERCQVSCLPNSMPQPHCNCVGNNSDSACNDGGQPCSGASRMLMGYGSQSYLSTCEMEGMWSSFLNKNQDFIDICSSPVNETPYILSSPTPIYWDSHKFVNSDLIIASGTELEISCTVEVANNRRIIVEKGAILRVNGGHLKGLCGTQWRGIVVEGDVINGQSNAGKVYVINNAIIENARDAVSMHPAHIPWPQTQFHWGGLLVAENSTFRNCNRAAEFMRFGTGGLYDNSYFENCLFENCGHGITSWANNGIRVENCIFEGITHSAVLVYDSSIDVKDNVFSSTHTGVDATATQLMTRDILIADNVFNTIEHGIYGNATGGAGALAVYDNYFFGGKYGMKINGASEYDIANNDFVGQEYGIHFHSSAHQTQPEVKFNQFSSVDRACLNNYDNTTIYNHNCYDFNGVDIEVNTGSINESQGDPIVAAGNCFTKGLTPEISAIDNYHFTYYIKKVDPDYCRTIAIPSGYSIGESERDTFLTCGPGYGVYSVGPVDILYRGCKVPRNRILALQMYHTLLAEINALEQNQDIDPDLKAFLLHTYRACLRRVERHIPVIIFEDETEDGGLENALSFAANSEDFSVNAIGVSLLMETGDYLDALDTLLSLTPVDEQEFDYIEVQKINIDFYLNRVDYELTQANRNKLLEIGNKTLPYSGFARGLYYLITGERIPVEPIKSGKMPGRSKMESKDELLSIKAYPNPVMLDEYYIDIRSNKENSQSFTYHIYNAMGEKVAENQLLSNMRNTINVSHITSGVYFVNVISSGEIVYSDKLVITR